MSETQYIVIRDHTLGYIKEGMMENFAGVLAGKPQLGGCDPKNGMTVIGHGIEYRPATKEDFDFFRVCLPPNFKE
jgi:hypothetical protein